MKILLLLLLIISTMAGYSPKFARSMAYICASTFSTQAQINNWSCQYCKENNVVNTKAFKNPILDIFGFTGYMPDQNAIIVTFRSTVSLQNWIANLDATQVAYPGCPGCLIHQGFFTAFNGVQSYIRAQFQRLTALYRGAKIYVTGYSLGSALATIAALDLKNLFGHVDQFYTFGQPRVGNEALANFFTAQIPERYRVIHNNDIVSHLPPQLPIPYSHFSFEIWYNKDMTTFKQCGAEEFKCSKSVLPTNWSTGDHDIKFYIAIKV